MKYRSVNLKTAKVVCVFPFAQNLPFVLSKCFIYLLVYSFSFFGILVGFFCVSLTVSFEARDG